jgi:hypothetical protein
MLINSNFLPEKNFSRRKLFLWEMPLIVYRIRLQLYVIPANSDFFRSKNLSDFFMLSLDMRNILSNFERLGKTSGL